MPIKTNLPHIAAPVLGLVLSTLAGAGTLPACDEPVWSVQAHSGRVSSVKLSPDGSLLASGGGGQSIHLWNASNGQSVRELNGPFAGVRSLSFSPDGTQLAAVTTGGSLQIWIVADGTLLRTLAGPANPDSELVATGPVEFSPDGSLIAAGVEDGRETGLWRVSDGGLVRRLPNSESSLLGILHLAFSPDGRWLAGGGGIRGRDTTIKIWRVNDGHLEAVIPTSNDYGVGGLAFSPDGTLLASGNARPGNAGRVELWRVSDWSRAAILSRQGTSLAFSPDGKFLLTANERKVELDFWRVANAHHLSGFRPDVGSGESADQLGPVAFSIDGASIFVGAAKWRRTEFGGTVSEDYVSSFETSCFVPAEANDGGEEPSDPLETWRKRSSPTTNPIRGIAVSETHWVAVAGAVRRDGSILVSRDGRRWSEIKEPDWPQLNGVAYGNGRFVAVGYGGIILSSSDAEKWDRQTHVSAGLLWDVAYGGGWFVVSGDRGTLRSEDGLNWIHSDADELLAGNAFVSFANGFFYRNGRIGVLLERSRDGLEWERVAEGLSWEEGEVTYGARISGVAYGNGLYVATGSATYVSEDGRSWRQSDSAGGGSILHANSVFVVPAAGRVRLSFDGLSWEERTSGLEGIGLNGAAYRGQRFVVVGDAGAIFQSDRLHWNYSRWADRVLGQSGSDARAFGQDVNGDDVLNGIAYAFGAEEFAVRNPVAVERSRDGIPSVTFHIREGAYDLRLRVDISEDLKNWTRYALEELPHDAKEVGEGKRRITVWPAIDRADSLFVQLGMEVPE